MNNSIPWDNITNLVFFLVGLAMGFIQLWQAQKYYLADQQTKFDQISKSLTDIVQRLAKIETSAARIIEIDKSLTSIGAGTDTLQDRLMTLVENQTAAREEAKSKAIVDTTEQIKILIQEEFSKSGFVTSAHLAFLESKIDTTLGKFSQKLLETAPDSLIINTAASEKRILQAQMNLSKLDSDNKHQETVQILELAIKRGNNVYIVNSERIPAVTLAPDLSTAMSTLAKARGSVVTLDELRKAYRGPDTLEEPSNAEIRVVIERLRRFIEVNPENSQYIISLAGGYLLQNVRIIN
ncbi:MAG: winged helix-turn-helix domain-containing protein [Chloroflexi bacterium]|nr:winged helix-turn-helix domain-containing protein [Chloroflexota bacterium]